MRTLAKYMIVFLMFGSIQLNAQFTITPVQPPTTFTFDDLWHLNVGGPNTSDYIEFYVSLRIYDNTTTSLMVKSNSAVFPFSQIPFYANHLNMGPLDPLNTLYYDFNLQNIIQNGGFFPVGTYDIQFVLLGKPLDGEFTEVAEFDYQLIVEAFWPPILIDPYNEDTIDNPLPILVWTPAFYASPGTTIEYSLWLVKMNANQDRYQAISSNPYTLENHNIMGTTLPYPPSAYGMQVGDQFAWQVAATVNNQPIAYTDVWTFVYYLDTIQDTTPPEPNFYFNLKRVEAISNTLEGIFQVNDMIRFQFDQEYGTLDTTKIKFMIKDTEGNTVFNSAQTNIYPLNYGLNRYAIDPCELNLDLNTPYFKLIAYNHKKEAYYLYFKFSSDFNCNN